MITNWRQGVRNGWRGIGTVNVFAAVGALAGTDCKIEPKGRMGSWNLWNICEYRGVNAINTVLAAAEPQPFPRCPWALDVTDKPFLEAANASPVFVTVRK